MVACAEEVKEEPKYSEEQLMLIGDWEELIGVDSVVNWIFSLEDLSWGNYTHHYEYEKKKVIVSGMDYTLIRQSEDTLDLLTPNQTSVRLIRKGKKKLPQPTSRREAFEVPSGFEPL